MQGLEYINFDYTGSYKYIVSWRQEIANWQNNYVRVDSQHVSEISISSYWLLICCQAS